LTDKVEHVDFYQIKEGEKIIVEVKLEFIGISRAVKEFNGVLTHELDRIEIECLPKDLIKNIEVDLTKLAEINDVIRVGDLEIPENVKILSDLESSVAAVKVIKVKEEVEEEKEATDSIEEEKEEGDEKKEEDSSSPTEDK